jgi:glucosamine-phosphate N-acetyltransferase
MSDITYEDIIYRKLAVSDYDAFLSLLCTFRDTFFTKEQFIKTLNHVTNVYVMEYHNEVIATGSIWFETKFIHNICKQAHIEDVCVLPSFRSFGIGKRMISKLVEIAQQECYKVILNCSDDHVGFYKKCHFEREGNEMVIRLCYARAKSEE